MPRSCDVCQTSSALVYCRADAAYLCMACDVKVHGANKLASRHERVWMCEVCEQAPAVVTCKADAAALCAACDTDIHTANPLASRHERFPVMPFFEPPAAAVVGLSNMDAIYTNGCEAGSVKDEGHCNEGDSDEDDEERSAAEAESWLVPPDGGCKNSEMFDVEHPDSVIRSYSSSFKAKPKKKDSSSAGFFPDDDLYLDLEHASAMGSSKVTVGDSIVPVRHPVNSFGPKYIHAVTPSLFELDHPLKRAYSLATDSLSHSISSSSHDFGVVPDSALSDVSMPVTAATAAQQIPQGQTATQLEPMAREARVMRYREKRKNRKFEKTIRYASRKAYAEIRPRVKGRFVKRSEIQVAEMFSVVPETAYGVVPTL